MVRKSQMMKGSLWSKTLPYLRIAVRAVTEMDSWTKPVMNQATQWTALFRPIIFITCSRRKRRLGWMYSSIKVVKTQHPLKPTANVHKPIGYR